MGDIVSTKSAAPITTSAVVRLASAGEANQYLTFASSGEMFAVGILNVREIIEYASLTQIPMMPAFIRGVINLRGAVVPVIDLAARFGGKATVAGRRTCIIIVEAEQKEGRHDIGIMVNAVSEVMEIAGSEIEPPPAFGAKIRADFIAGMGKIGGKFVIILDLMRMLSFEEMAAIADAGGATQPTVAEPTAG